MEIETEMSKRSEVMPAQTLIQVKLEQVQAVSRARRGERKDRFSNWEQKNLSIAFASAAVAASNWSLHDTCVARKLTNVNLYALLQSPHKFLERLLRRRRIRPLRHDVHMPGERSVMGQR